MDDFMTQEDAMRMDNEQAIQILKPFRDMMIDQNGCPISDAVFALDKAIDALSAQQWIPCKERLPENTNPVNITWVNHQPESYYDEIKDKPFTATGCYCDGKWYWYSVYLQDMLDEYRYSAVDSMDESIEVIAWMPLPEPYKGETNA